MSIIRKLRTLGSVPLAENVAFAEAAIGLAFARLLVDFVPLSRWRKQISVSSKQIGVRSQLAKEQRFSSRLVARTIKRVGRNVPVEFACLPQALAARWMLSRRGVPTELFIGTRKAAEENREFHAWLMVGDIMVTGDCNPEDYAVLGSQRRG
ncbi:MAG: lasso peptide biosynthesis B2 protein [Pontixanthobacter sp.]